MPSREFFAFKAPRVTITNQQVYIYECFLYFLTPTSLSFVLGVEGWLGRFGYQNSEKSGRNQFRWTDVCFAGCRFIIRSCAYSCSNKKRPHETATSGHRQESESNNAIRRFKNNTAVLVHSSIRWRESIVYKCFDLFSSRSL